jgi:HD-like signal output (HDOD) protein
MGGYLLGIWGLPDPIVEAVTLHHSPDVQTVKQPGPLTALHLANGLVHFCQSRNRKNYALYLDMPYLEKLGLVERLGEWVSLTHEILNQPN